MDRKVVGMSIYLSIHPSINLSIHPSMCLSICPSVYLFPYLFIYLSTYPSSCLSTSLSVYLPIHLSAFPSISLPLYLSMQPFIHQTACLCVYLSTYWEQGSLRHRQSDRCRIAETHQVFLLGNEPSQKRHSRLLSSTVGVFRPSSSRLPLHSHNNSTNNNKQKTHNQQQHPHLHYNHVDWHVCPPVHHRLHQQFQDIDSPNFCLQVPVTCGSVIETPSKTKQFCETCSLSKHDNIENAAILQAFLNVLTSQHRKRSNSPRCLQCFNSTTSKAKQVCETSFKNGKLSAELTASYQCVLRFFQSNSPPVESTAPATKKWCQVIRSASKPEDLMLQNATPLRKSAPSPPNSSDEDVSCTAPATENASL